jgi:chromosome segregation ATPase
VARAAASASALAGGSFFDLYRGRWGCSYRHRRKTCDNALVIPGAALEETVLTAVRESIDEQVAERALEVALEELRRRAQSFEPGRIEAELATVDAKIERVLDALVDLDSDAPAVKERLQGLQAERVRLTRELARSSATLPSVEELRPLLREKLADLRATLGASPQGRMALGALLDGERLIVHPDGRIEGLVRVADGPVVAGAVAAAAESGARGILKDGSEGAGGLPMP